MAHFCGFIKLIFLLLMLARIPSNESRPLKGNAQANSDLIAGNEFLKLFLEQDQLDKDINSSEYVGGGGGSEHELHKRNESAPGTKTKESYDKKLAETGRRPNSGRSLKDNAPLQNQAGGQLEDSKQVVKLVTSGSKIVFLEDYDENDAILDAEVRDIDLKKEVFKNKSHSNLNDYKVVAVSVSSSSQRGTATARNQNNISTTTNKKLLNTTTKTTTTTTTTTKKPLRASSTKTDNIAGDNFINRSHKSEFSIEEVEPLTMAQHKSRKTHTRHRSSSAITSVADTLEAIDSENSASTNIHNILAAPLQQAASARSSSMMTSKYHNGQRNVTINHETNLHSNQYRSKTDNDNSNHSETERQQQSQQTSGVEDQLLPFQTVIYHDTKAGHGPQSRSISYSSISQNVEDLKKWQQSGILAEARRNVSESLKPMPRTNSSVAQQQAESMNFYSQPSKMYSEPSKFYSEPAKVYSEPAKVYGEPEKFYSEPAKVYSQPSKFYSEPSKVYSQPAKVYSEPAKTYWPLTATTTTASDSVNTLIPPTNAPPFTTTLPPMVNILHHASRKPAIVSRIAFGEAHSTSTSTTTTSSSTTPTSTTSSPLTTTAASKTYGTHGSHQYTRTYSSHRNPSHSPFNNENSSLSSSLSPSTPSRRILFNLDRLPYDLLNAPESSVQQQQLSQQSNSNRPQQTLTYNQHQQQQQQQQQQRQQQQRHNINPCLESAVSSLFSSSSLSAHPSVVKQRQQPDSQQHSNQNAKGLPNGDLVRCVAEISHTPSAATDDGSDGAFTTERSHMEELFTPTPEQNYEIEESVSVMTNGRAHGGGDRNSFAQPTISSLQQQQYHGFKPNRQQTRIHFGTNVDNQQPAEVQQHQRHHHQLSQLPYNTNANANVATGNRHNNNNAADYNDDGSDGDGGEVDDGSVKNSDYEDDENNTGRGSPANGNNDDDEDSKVAYVVEGRNYRKYRVEEKTDDGFIVGEYGVVDHNDGNLRGVRYTADSTINPSLIQKALLTFLKLK